MTEDASVGDVNVDRLREHVTDLTRKFQMVSEKHLSQTDEVSLLERIIHLSAAPQEFDVLAEGYMDLAMDCVKAESGALYFFDSEAGELYFATARGPKARDVLALDITIKPGQGLVGHCFATKELIVVSDVGSDDRYSREVSQAVGYEVRSIMTAPIIADGVVLGALQVINKDRSDTFDPGEVSMLQRLGRYAGYSFSLFLQLMRLESQVGGAEVEAPEGDESGSEIVDMTGASADGAAS